MSRPKTKPAPMPSIVELGAAELEAANDYLASSAQVKEATPVKERSKAQLLAALGDCKVGMLPDGRTVRKKCTEFVATTIERKAYTSVNIDID
jgi:hypothetical protein